MSADAKLLAREPTPEMVNAVQAVTSDKYFLTMAPRMWRAMWDVAPAPAPAAEPTQAARDVLSERQRQVSAEGWTKEHDDKHQHADLAIAAAALAVNGTDATLMYDGEDAGNWWGLATKHKDDRRRQLVISGALILAEIERLDRAAAPAPAPAAEHWPFRAGCIGLWNGCLCEACVAQRPQNIATGLPAPSAGAGDVDGLIARLLATRKDATTSTFMHTTDGQLCGLCHEAAAAIARLRTTSEQLREELAQRTTQRENCAAAAVRIAIAQHKAEAERDAAQAERNEAIAREERNVAAALTDYHEAAAERDAAVARAEAAEADAIFGRILMRYIDRLTDHCDIDPAHKIISELSRDVGAALDAAREGVGNG